MNQLFHLQKNKPLLELRSTIIRAMREFFWQEGFLEVETPLLLKLPGQEPHLSPMKAILHNERGETFNGYLHTSPEYAMKKMLAAGFDRIFSLGKVFRDRESFGGAHNPEFTMMEWYRAHVPFWTLMEDLENMLQYIIQKLAKLETGNWKLQSQFPSFEFRVSSFERIHMRDLWRKYADVNLDKYLDQPSLLSLCRQKGYAASDDEPYEDLFYRIFLNEIEPRIETENPLIIHHYPAPMAALAKLSDDDTRYAERFELYWKGMELANAFTELTDATEQRRRLEEERERRQALKKDVFDIDEDFLDAVGRMPPSSGIALGVDRLVMALTGCEKIEDVIALPASVLFQTRE